MNHQMHGHHHDAPSNAASHSTSSHDAGALAGSARHRLSFSATMHCLIGCGIGEVAGVIIGTAFDMNMMNTMALGIILGFVMGFALGSYPLLKAGFGVKRALRQVLIAEGLSIAVMEAFEVLVQIYMPGVMEAGLRDAIYWYGMAAALAVGFIAAYPVNWYLIGRGVRHQH